MDRKRKISYVVAAAATGMFALSAHAASLSTVQHGDWFDPATWGGSTPTANDDVTIGHNLTLGSSTGSLNSLTLNTGSLTTSGWMTKIQANDVTLNAGNVTHDIQTDTDGSDGWTPDARVWIEANNVTVGSSASINANQSGYFGGWYNGSSDNSSGSGFGPGAGDGRHGGAGYGGRGNPEDGGHGKPYGDFFQANDPGSGGGVHTRNSGSGGDGGGAIRIEATGAVLIDGTLTANGGNNGTGSMATTTFTRGAGGSGGGIFLQAGTLAGIGTISADGGNGTYTLVNRGGAGGGRVAVTSQASSFAGSITVDRGNKSSNGNWPDYGTLFSLTGEPTAGATSTTTDATPSLDTALSVTANDEGVVFDRNISDWTQGFMEWTDDSLDTNGISLTNEATYTLAGLLTDTDYFVFDNGSPISPSPFNSGAAGEITFNVTLASPHTITVTIPEPAAAGLLLTGGFIMLARRRRG
ncbi:MAG: PEP-CTERM sorting domain-containing protein [Phycisphaeraceae bacterium]